jgi:hypothetical protein
MLWLLLTVMQNLLVILVACRCDLEPVVTVEEADVRFLP